MIIGKELHSGKILILIADVQVSEAIVCMFSALTCHSECG